MEQLFKCKTVKQRKIVEWLTEQGITAGDIADTKLSGPAMIRVTNPGGQYMDLYCDDAYDVRVLDVPVDREEEIEWLFWNETNDPETEEWRDELTADEAAMVEQWDERTARGFQALVQDNLSRQPRVYEEEKDGQLHGQI